ncbi:hypothetical protein Raf01_47280 [Rugosimonospora africana]|uniref:Uncharacterized protein n=2 Tax=Rugosimonospora africana TaxID=556532 RepID=A0A8J3VSG0_9ACTN|nr:hypothetical protein Raf01_47280 [Rugosimonospora africana]
MDADRVVEAVRRFVLDPSEDVQRRRDEVDSVTLRTARLSYEIRPAPWSVAAAPWVRDAVRVLADSGNASYLPTFGLLLLSDGDVVFLNDVAAMRQLGRRLGDGLDPVAYAELLAELHYSRGQRDEPVARPSAPGRLIRDPRAFLDRYPFVDPALPRAPEAGDDGRGGTVITFQSFIRYLRVEVGTAIDVYGFTVTAPRGGPATWSVRDEALRIDVPRNRRG